MRALSLNTLVAILVVATAAGCASKKTDDSTQTTAAVPTNTAAPAQTTAVDSGSVQGSDLAVDTVGGAPLAGATSADGFENNPANYTGDTRTRVIYFAFDRAEVPAAAYATLKAHAKHLAANPNARLKLEGHADERGTPEYNVALAERRAKAVQKFLSLAGVRAEQVEVVSFGEEKPADLGHDELAWAKNRRAELVYTAGQP